MSARILLIDAAEDSDLARLGRELGRFPFSIDCCAAEDIGRALSGENQPDVVVLDARDIDRFKAVATEIDLLDIGHSDGSPKPIVIVITRRDGAVAASLADYGHVVFAPVEPSRLAGRIKALLRQVALEREIDRRMRAAKKLGLDLSKVDEITPPEAKMLVVGVGQCFLKLQKATTGFATLHGALSIAAAHDRLAEDRFDTVVIDTGVDYDAAVGFVADLRRNPHQTQLPVVKMVDRGMMFGVADALAAGMTEMLPSTISTADLAVHLAIHAGACRAERELRRAAEVLHVGFCSEPTTGLIDARFLAAYLDTEAGDNRPGRADHVLRIRIEDAETDAGRDQMVRRIGALAEKTVRAECLVARAAADAVAIVVPSSTMEEADAVLSRITAILHMTAFSDSDDTRPAPDFAAEISASDLRKSA
ncbi:MAG: hypothetical protein KDJ16_17875 [Hyphomicrobiales bacterium]|nr:hypothetical protein [Hyphomicrobiales bacterium]